MSTSWTSRKIDRITPFISATYVSRVPKSVVSVMTATSTVAIDHEVGDQRKGFSFLRRREDRQRRLRRPRILVRSGQGVFDALVIDDVAPDLVDLVRVEGMALEEAPHALGLCGGRSGEHGDQRQGALALPQVGADGLAETILIGDEVERVVRDLERHADVQAVLGEGIDLRGREAAQERAYPAARRHERRGPLGDDPQIVRLGGDPAPLEL